MIFKNKLIIYIAAGFIPTQLEYPSFGELERYQWRKCTTAIYYEFRICIFALKFGKDDRKGNIPV